MSKLISAANAYDVIDNNTVVTTAMAAASRNIERLVIDMLLTVYSSTLPMNLRVDYHSTITQSNVIVPYVPFVHGEKFFFGEI